MPLPDFDLGQTFQPKNIYDDHPHIVINTPANHSGIALCVNITGWVSNCDCTCVLEIGCHEIVRKKSFVFYARPKEIPAMQLRQLHLADKLDAPLPLMPDALLRAIIAGTRTSPHFNPDKYGRLLD
jgi:hypothetical protein